MKDGQITAAVIGAGYAARLHGAAFGRLHGLEVRLKRIIDPDQERAASVKKMFGFEMIGTDISEALADPEVDVIDICTPPMLHYDMIKASLAAGKHVICEKPLVGYFGKDTDILPVGRTVPKRKMYEDVLAQLEDLKNAVYSAGKVFGYAENYAYSAAVTRMREMIRAKSSRLLFLKGEESLRGSKALAAGEWSNIGGGALIRAGVHPLSSILLLKKAEAEALGKEIRVSSVSADMGMVTLMLDEHEHRHIMAYPNDVEDYASVNITFSDGSKGHVTASDLHIGGTRGFLEAYANDGVLRGKISPVDVVESYYLDEENLEDISISEMLAAKTGWNYNFVEDEVIRGFAGELQDFCSCILSGKRPVSDIGLACETMQVVYAAYLSAEEGRTVEL